MLKSSHHPDGKIADVLAPTHARTKLRTLRSTTILLGFNLVLPGICKCQPRLQNAHCPHADALASTLACAPANAAVNYTQAVRATQRP
jgi:hypothetical protein